MNWEIEELSEKAAFPNCATDFKCIVRGEKY